MKLVIQIPCFNEEKNLPATLKDLPKQIPGIDEIDILIIDDGSTDRTKEIAKQHGVKHMVSFTKNQGLAYAFSVGLEEALKLGADIIVNTDADNQYQGKYIDNLVKPVLAKDADIVIGARPIKKIPHFSPVKKFLQLFGSRVVQGLTGLNISDATSGFRAYSREAALKLKVISKFTYTLETIIQAGHKGLAVKTVPIEVNAPMRKSRLFTTNLNYVLRSMDTILRVKLMYQPLQSFLRAGIVSVVIGLLIGLRFLYFFFMGEGSGHIQSLILVAILLIIGFIIILLGLLADLIADNRLIQEEILYIARKNRIKERD